MPADCETPATRDLAAFFEPRVVAVIGANREPNKIGSEILHNLQATHYTGTLIPVHPAAAAILELDVNPLIVLPDGVSAVDVRIRVAATGH